jgi:hypothetical protein
VSLRSSSRHSGVQLVGQSSGYANWMSRLRDYAR